MAGAAEPPSAGPLTTLRDRFPLTAFGGEVHAAATVAAPGGGAHVALTSSSDSPAELVTLGQASGASGALDVTSRVDLGESWIDDLHALPDGSVVVVGNPRAMPPAPAGGDEEGYRFSVVDPVTGTARTTVLEPYDAWSDSAWSVSALSADGATLYLLVTSYREAGAHQALVAYDVATGDELGRRDAAPDLAEVSPHLLDPLVVGMLPRPDGGVTVVVNGEIGAECYDHAQPAVLTFDADLRPAGRPVVLAEPVDGWRAGAVAPGPDGAVLVTLGTRDGRRRVVAVPDGGGAGSIVAQFVDEYYESGWFGLSVEPAGRWALVPTLAGVRAVDLVAGRAGRELRLDCLDDYEGSFGTDEIAGLHTLLPLARGDGALLVGRCPGVDSDTVWRVGP